MQRNKHLIYSVFLFILSCLLSCLPLLSQGSKAQAIRFAPIGDRPANTAPFQIIALSSAFLPVTLNVQGPASIQGRLITLVGVGTVTVSASQAGNAEYAPASAQISFRSTPVPATLSWVPPTIPYGTPIHSALLNASALAAPLIDPATDAATVSSQLNTSFIVSDSSLSYPASFSIFRYEGSSLTPTTDPNGSGGYDSNALPAPYGLDYRVAFTCDCQQFEFVLQARGARYRLWVDGAYTSTDATAEPNAYPQRDYVLVHFPDKRSRQIKMMISGNAPFFGVNTVAGDTIASPQVPLGPRVFIFGDSWTGPTILEPILPPTQTGLYGSGYPQTLGEYFNWDYWDDGVGGSGFTVAGTDILHRTFVERAVSDMCSNAPKAIVLLGGTNDGGKDESAMQTAVSSTLSELQACLPNVPVYLYGPQFAVAPLDQAMAAAVTSATSNVSYTDMGNASWFYGSETDPGTGNNYLYFYGHPTPLGHDYLAEQIAQDLITKFPELLPQPYTASSLGPVAGTFSYSIAPGTVLAVGQHAVSIVFTPQDSVNYQAANFTGTLTVARATTNISLSASQVNGTVTLTTSVSPQISGTPTGTVTFSDKGMAFGSAPVISGVAIGKFTNTDLPQGAHTVTASYSGDGNFLPSPPSTPLSVTNTAPDFSFALDQLQISLLPGTSASLEVQVTPVGGLVSNLNLSCQGLPQNAICSLMNGPITVNQNPVLPPS